MPVAIERSNNTVLPWFNSAARRAAERDRAAHGSDGFVLPHGPFRNIFSAVRDGLARRAEWAHPAEDVFASDTLLTLNCPVFADPEFLGCDFEGYQPPRPALSRECIEVRDKIVEGYQRKVASFQLLGKGLKEHLEATSRERVRALREGNETEYLRLLRAERTARFEDMVDETERILQSLARRVATTTRGRTEEVIDQLEGRREGYREEVTLPTPQCFARAKGRLKAYQLAGVQWLYDLHSRGLSGILADEMGLGKTVQAIALLAHLLEQHDVPGPHLVIAPLSTLPNWETEIKRWSGDAFDVVLYHGSYEERMELMEVVADGEFDILLCQYSLIQDSRCASELAVLRSIPWETVVVDEGHRLKNPASAFSRNIRSLTSNYRLLLTGTPLQNDVRELWALLNFLLPTVFDPSADFSEWFSKGGDEGEEEHLILARRLHKVLRPFMLRREKADVLADLPPRTEHYITVPLTPLQLSLYNQARQHGVIGYDCNGDRSSHFVGGASLFMALRKVCLHPFLLWPGSGTLFTYSLAVDDPAESLYNSLLVKASGKAAILTSMLAKLRATHHKVLVFSQFATMLDIIEDILVAKGWGSLYHRIDGTVAVQSRQNSIDDFNNPDSDCFVFLLTTKAGGQGLNLQMADTVIIYDVDWNPQQDLQAMARAHRVGQERAVRVYFLMTAAPVEQHMAKVIKDKLLTEALNIRAGRYNQTSTTTERDKIIRDILSVECSGGGGDVMASDEDLVRVLARDDSEAELMRGVGPPEIVDTTPLLPPEFFEAQSWAVAERERREALREGRLEGYGYGCRVPRKRAGYESSSSSDPPKRAGKRTRIEKKDNKGSERDRELKGVPQNGMKKVVLEDDASLPCGTAERKGATGCVKKMTVLDDDDSTPTSTQSPSNGTVDPSSSKTSLQAVETPTAQCTEQCQVTTEEGKMVVTLPTASKGQCPQCTYTTRDRSTMRSHLREAHKVTAVVRYALRTVHEPVTMLRANPRCPFCNVKLTTRVAAHFRDAHKLKATVTWLADR
eukprot:Sspe_Gene.62678::Locus_35360_Transcript_1_1_Confidence_1.000_Length_3679::g.62678::m.62678/K11786/STH1_SNF2; ATP-dependent helicase STH1/SNF2